MFQTTAVLCLSMATMVITVGTAQQNIPSITAYQLSQILKLSDSVLPMVRFIGFTKYRLISVCPKISGQLTNSANVANQPQILSPLSSLYAGLPPLPMLFSQSSQPRPSAPSAQPSSSVPLRPVPGISLTEWQSPSMSNIRSTFGEAWSQSMPILTAAFDSAQKLGYDFVSLTSSYYNKNALIGC